MPELRTYKGDLHIHTQLSPCGSLDNSPATILKIASQRGMDFIAICDHNTTRQAMLVVELAKQMEIEVFPGVELNSKEEVHCLAIFKDGRQLQKMQEYIDVHLPKMKNNPEYFGYQVVVDEDENIIYTEDYFLHAALDVGIEALCDFVHQLGGVFIPAHIDRKGNGLLSQLGFLPPLLQYDALEVHRNTDEAEFRNLEKQAKTVSILKNSDAHYPENIAQAYSNFTMPNLSFESFKDALEGKNGCSVTPNSQLPTSNF